MSDDYPPTVRIRRPARVTTDDHGRTVWADTIETVQLELVSTAQLQALLQSDDHDNHGAIRKVLARKEEGVLARDPATGLFEVISDDDLQAILGSDDAPPGSADVTREPAPASTVARTDELSLVSTQMLRKIVLPEDNPPAKKPAAKPAVAKKDPGGGFDPYNNG